MKIRRAAITTQTPTTRLDTLSFAKGENNLWVFVNGVKAIVDIDYEEVSCSIINFMHGLPTQSVVELVVFDVD